jgi:8-oxo-dGTP pyrophosphatase MutT (NUDIX family)
MGEETGIQVEVGAFLDFTTDFFYYDPLDLALHGFLFYYHCTPVTLALNPPEYPPEEDLEFPLWAEVVNLNAESFQGHGEMTMKLIERCLALN